MFWLWQKNSYKKFSSKTLMKSTPSYFHFRLREVIRISQPFIFCWRESFHEYLNKKTFFCWKANKRRKEHVIYVMEVSLLYLITKFLSSKILNIFKGKLWSSGRVLGSMIRRSWVRSLSNARSFKLDEINWLNSSNLIMKLLWTFGDI